MKSLLKLAFCPFLFLIFASTALLAQDQTEWFQWGPSNSYHVKAQRLASDSSTLHGSYLAFFQELTIAKGEFKQGKKVDHWTYYNLQGTLKAEGNYQNGLKHGVWLHYFDNQQLKAQTYWNAGVRAGEWKSYYRSGVPYSEIVYSNNFPEKFIAFYNNGDSALIRSFQQQENVVLGHHRSYHFQAQIYEDYRFTFENSDSTFNQLTSSLLPENQRAFFDESIKQQILPASSFKLDGHYRKYHPTGPLWIHHVYDEGQLLNVIPSFDKWGNIASHGNFKNGNGTLILHHSIGDTAVIQSYENGFPNGSFYLYEEGNRLRQKGEFCNGLPCGSWMTYNVNLKPKYHYTFESPASYHRENRSRNNRLDKIEFFENGYLDGPVVQFDQYGDTLSFVSYKNGKATGPQRYYVNGNLKTSGQAFQDILVGEWVTLNPSGKVTFKEEFKHQGYWNPNFQKPKNTMYLIEPEASDFSFKILNTQIPAAFLENQTVLVNGRLYEIELRQGEMEGDVVFSFDLENTGHVRSIECVKHSGSPYYQASLTLLEGLLFAEPVQAFGFPKDSSFLISLYFNPL